MKIFGEHRDRWDAGFRFPLLRYGMYGMYDMYGMYGMCGMCGMCGMYVM